MYDEEINPEAELITIEEWELLNDGENMEDLNYKPKKRPICKECQRPYIKTKPEQTVCLLCIRLKTNQ